MQNQTGSPKQISGLDQVPSAIYRSLDYWVRLTSSRRAGSSLPSTPEMDSKDEKSFSSEIIHMQDSPPRDDSKSLLNSPPRPGSKEVTSIFTDKSYAQMYVIMKEKADDADSKRTEGNEVLFRCGNWCYRGQIQFHKITLRVKELPIIIPTLQRQQSCLRYFCNSSNVPKSCVFHDPIEFVNHGADFFAMEMVSQEIEDNMARMSTEFPWMLDDKADTYFELELENTPECMDNVAIIASKTYVNGLIIIGIYYSNSLYFVIKDGEGNQALLDVKFPDVTKKGQGIHLASYTKKDSPFTKFTLWNLVEGGNTVVKVKDIPKVNTLSVSSRNYQQTYCILKSAWEGASPALSIHHDALFRFGSWCYAGRVQLTPAISLSDVPFVIPALRMQQSRLEYLCNTNQVPTTSPFANALDYLQRHEEVIERVVEESADTLQALIDRLSKMGLGESVTKWLDGDPNSSFFEFKLEPDQVLQDLFKTVELICSKSYHASGIVTINIMYNFTIYVCIQDGSNENPLLDSKFPDVSGKGRGYQVQAYDDGGHPDWPALKRVSVWQTVNALEQEFRDRAAAMASKKDMAGTSADLSKMFESSAAADQAGQLMGSEGTGSFPQHKEGQSLRENVDPASIRNVGNYDGSKSTLSTDGIGRDNGFNLEEVEVNRLKQFEEETRERNLSDFKSIGGRINSYVNAGQDKDDYKDLEASMEASHGSMSGKITPILDTPKVAESKEDSTPVKEGSNQFQSVAEDDQHSIGMSIRSNTNHSLAEDTVANQSAWAEEELRRTYSISNVRTPKEVEEQIKEHERRVQRDRAAKEAADSVAEASAKERAEDDHSSLTGSIGYQHDLSSPLNKSPNMSIKDNLNSTPLGSLNTGTSKMARPHHLPKMDSSLNKRMESIRASMGNEPMDAPWDASGKPLKKLASPMSGDSK